MPDNSQTDKQYISCQLSLTFPENVEIDAGNEASEIEDVILAGAPVENQGEIVKPDDDAICQPDNWRCSDPIQSGTEIDGEEIKETIPPETTTNLIEEAAQIDVQQAQADKALVESMQTVSVLREQQLGHYLFVDLETGGLYADKHAILQVGAVITDLDFNIKGQFMSYVQPHPKLKITEEALRVNSLRLEDLETAPCENTVALALRQFANLPGHHPRFAGYNCPFDLEFLARLWQRHSLSPTPYQVPWLDICAVSRFRLGSALSSFKLASVASHFNLNTDGAHDAVADLMMTIEIAKRLRSLPENPAPERNGIDLATVKFSDYHRE